MADNGKKEKLTQSSGSLVAAVELARKVTRPLTFFASMGFLLVILIPIIYQMTPDNASLQIALTPALLCVALSIDILCVLIWAKAKLAQDPNAFKDES